MLDYLESKFNRIIIDTPPSLPVSDPIIIGKLTRNVLLIVKDNNTNQDSVEKILKN